MQTGPRGARFAVRQTQGQPRSARAARLPDLLPVAESVVDDDEFMLLESVPEALEPVLPEDDVPLVLVLPIEEPALSVVVPELLVPEFVVPAVPLVALGLAVLVPGPGLAVVDEPLSALPVLPVLDEPADVPELPPADDCAYEKPAAASSDTVAAAMARPFEIWFMV